MADAIIRGITEGQADDGSWPERREIDDFVGPEGDPKQVFLFLAALTKVQNEKPDQALSHFQIAGIHGLPYRAWPPNDKTTSDKFMYCPHWSMRFPMWHRVYVLLYEQTLHRIMMRWVDPNTSSEDSPIPKDKRADFYNSAATWRFPYWDLGAWRPYNKDRSSIPLCATSELIQDMGHAWDTLQKEPVALAWHASLGEKRNPLYSYKFSSEVTSGGYGLQPSLASKTFRHPRNGTTNLNSVKAQFARESNDLRWATLSAFAAKTFNAFIGMEPSSTSNIDAVHGAGHNATGGSGGHMTSLLYAAFDPLFFLHHCNIDRLIALWQAGHTGPEKENWIVAVMDAPTRKRDDPAKLSDENTPLEPFYMDEKTLWTSKHARYISQLGYSYPTEFGVTSQKVMTMKINNLYGTTKFPIDAVGTATFGVAEIGPFKLVFYLRKGQDNQPTDPEIGRVVNFVAPVNAPCANCASNRERRAVSSLSTNLTARLVDPDIFGDAVKNWTKAQFTEKLKPVYWKLFETTTDGDVEVPVTKLTSLTVLIRLFDNSKTALGKGLEAGEEDPKPTVLTEITSGQPGGLEEGKPLPWDIA